MGRFLLRRAGQSLLLLLLVSMIAFAVLHLAPGGPLSMFTQGGQMTQADLDRIAHQLGLDQPLPVQYAEWLWHLVQGDWGRSYRDQQPVLATIFSHLGATLELMLTSTLIAMLIGGWVGVLGAIRRYSLFDTMASVGSMVALSIPTFWFGLVMIYLFSVELAWLPAGNQYTVGDGSFSDLLQHLILPALVLGLVSTATWSRYTRASVVEVMNQDYIRTARSKGLTERTVIMRHAFRNALMPLASIVPVDIITLVGGAIITETVFNWSGMGHLFVDALGRNQQYPVMAYVTIVAILAVVANFVADLIYAVLDPRIRVAA
jgi:peptide/nickel transport system permease protein